MPLTGTKVLLTAALFPLGRSPYSDGTSCSLMILGDAPETQEKIKQVSAAWTGKENRCRTTPDMGETVFWNCEVDFEV